MTEMMSQIYDILDKTVEVKIDAEKARIICDDLSQDFFIQRDKRELDSADLAIIRAYYHDAGVKNDIVLDYIYRLEQRLAALYEMVDAVFDDLQERKPISIPMADWDAIMQREEGQNDD